MSSLVSSIVDGLRRAGFVILVGACAGMAVYAAGTGSFRPSSWPPTAIVNSILVGILYGALLDGSVRLMRLTMQAFVPVRSTRAVAYHAAGPALGTLLVFLAVTAGFKTALGSAFVPSWPLLVGVGAIAAIGVGAASGVLALQLYHERDRQDHAEGWEARMRRLRTQTCPDILFPTLETVAQLLDEQPRKAKPLVEKLQSLLQYRRRAGRGEPVPLAEEIDAALAFVELAQVQYGDALDVGFDVPESVLPVSVPRLCLLPLLENAVEHGAGRLEEPCTVTITGRHDDEQLCLAVLDTGPGFDTTDPQTVLRRGSGISDLYARLRDHFGKETDLSLLPQGVLWCAPLDPNTTPTSKASDVSMRSS